MFKKFGLPAILTIIAAAVNYYLTLPAMNIKSGSFWSFILFILVVYVVLVIFFTGKAKISDLLKGVSPVQPKKIEFKKIIEIRGLLFCFLFFLARIDLQLKSFWLL